MMKSLFFAGLLACVPGLTFAETTDEAGLPSYPTWGVSLLKFGACTADGYAADVQVKISNFSSTDMTVSDGMVWASLEETTAAAQEAFSGNIPPAIATYNAEEIEQAGPEYMLVLAQVMTTIHGELEDGRVGDWPVNVDTKNMLQTKMILARAGKYTALRTFFDPGSSWVKVDRSRSCANSR